MSAASKADLYAGPRDRRFKRQTGRMIVILSAIFCFNMYEAKGSGKWTKPRFLMKHRLQESPSAAAQILVYKPGNHRDHTRLLTRRPFRCPRSLCTIGLSRNWANYDNLPAACGPPLRPRQQGADATGAAKTGAAGTGPAANAAPHPAPPSRLISAPCCVRPATRR